MRYSRLPGAEPLRLLDCSPALHDRSSTTSVDPHYYYLSGWGMRRIVQSGAERHVDVGSLAIFVNLLASVVPVTFVDYRPLQARLSGLECVGGSIVQLPFADDSLPSLSCLHVAEHIGLGRYGDPLDPQGTVRAAQELARVLAPGGSLYFAVPVGRPRVCFNAHRVHAPEEVRGMFTDLDLVEHSGVHDDGTFVEHVDLEEFRDSEYACGMFRFTKPEAPSARTVGPPA